MVLLSSVFGALSLVCFQVFPLLPLPIGESQGPSLVVFFSTELIGLQVGQVYGVFHRPGFAHSVVGGAHGWVAGWVGLWGVLPTWVWVGGTSPQILEHPTSICNTGVKGLKQSALYVLFRMYRL